MLKLRGIENSLQKVKRGEAPGADELRGGLAVVSPANTPPLNKRKKKQTLA